MSGPEVAEELLEREGELQALARALERAGRGLGGALAFEGPAGIGKTTLLAAARAHAERTGTRVLQASGRELERDFPFGVARQLVEAPLRNASSAEREGLLSDAAASAAALLGPVPSGPAAPDVAFALTHGLYWLTANLAELQPLLLAVDDLHWADDDSLRALAFLAARVEELPVLLVVSRRPGEPEAAAAGAALASGPFETLRLEPLSPTATADVVRAAAGVAVSDELCNACYRATGGNPFLARELARAAIAEGISDERSDAARLGELAPETVTRATLPRIRSLGNEALALSRAVAVLDRAELHHAAALAELKEPRAAEWADALAEAGMLAGGLPLRFAHPILRAAVLKDFSPAARDRAHRRAAELLERAGANAEAVAPHLMRTEPRGDAWAVAALRSAAQQALATGAPEVAARALRRALAEKGESGRAGLLHELGQAEAAFGDPAASERLVAAHEAAEDPVGRAEILATLAETRFVAGELAPAVEAFRNGLDELHGHGDTVAEVQLFLGYTMVGRAFAPTAREAHDRIRQRTAARDADAGLGEAARLAALAYDGFLRGEPSDGVRAAGARALADTSLLEAGGPAAQAFYLAAWALAGSDGFEPAEAALQTAIDRTGGTGSFLAFAMACHHRLWSRWRRGQVLHALGDAEVALELAARGWHLIRPAAAWAQAECLLERGDPAAAADAVTDAETLMPGLAGSCVAAWPLMGRSRLELERGNPSEALGAALRCGALLEALYAGNPAVADWRSRAALAAAALGDEVRARELWEEELRLARAFGAPRAIGIAARVAGVVEGGERGLAHLREAVEVLEASPAVLERARALTDLGAALRRARQPREARDPLRHGLALAGSCGATALVARARAELSAAGARPRREAISGLAALTPRELQIAELAAEGLGNREIAQALFITRKTVESHMRSVFRKLGIAAREQLADLIGR